MTFSEILPFMNEGFAVSRDEYKESLIIFNPIILSNIKATQ